MCRNDVRNRISYVCAYTLVSPNTLLFGDAIPTEQSLLAKIDRIPTATPPRTIRDYEEKLMDWQSRLIVAAQKSQQKVNADNL